MSLDICVVFPDVFVILLTPSSVSGSCLTFPGLRSILHGAHDPVLWHGDRNRTPISLPKDNDATGGFKWSVILHQNSHHLVYIRITSRASSPSNRLLGIIAIVSKPSPTPVEVSTTSLPNPQLPHGGGSAVLPHPTTPPLPSPNSTERPAYRTYHGNFWKSIIHRFPACSEPLPLWLTDAFSPLTHPLPLFVHRSL